MNLLCDTSAVIRSLVYPERIGKLAKSELEDQDSHILVSVVSLWEIAIKSRIGKISISAEQIYEGTNLAGFELIDLTYGDLSDHNNVELSHNDPFDRLLCSIARSRGVPLLTSDKAILDSSESTIDLNK